MSAFLRRGRAFPIFAELAPVVACVAAACVPSLRSRATTHWFNVAFYVLGACQVRIDASRAMRCVACVVFVASAVTDDDDACVCARARTRGRDTGFRGGVVDVERAHEIPRRIA